MIWAYSATLVLQLVGSAFTIFEIRQGVKRWRDQYGPRRTVGHLVASTARIESSVRASLTLAPLPPDATTEQIVARIGSLEDSLTTGLDRVHERADRERRESQAYAADVTRKAADGLQQQVSDVVGYLVAQGQRHWWLPWWLGPSLLLLGTIVGGVADVVDAR